MELPVQRGRWTRPRTSGRTIAIAAGVLAMAVVGLAITGGLAQAAPPAGTAIGNQASASYLDASGTLRTVTSNLVTTIVQQVASFTLTADGTRTAAPGGQASFPHTLTNTGNGTDAFSLSLANQVGDDFDLTGLAIYADANGDGVPDNFTALASTGPLAAGASFRFVVVGSVPGTQVGGNVGQMRITGTSTFDAGQTAFNTDVVTVSGNAVISVTKSINQGSGASPSGPYTYTLTYTNTGSSTATALRLTDAIPAGMTYRAGSGRWSVTGAAVLTDASNADAQGIVPNTIVYDFGATTGGTVTATIAQVPPGASGILTFQVDVNAGLPPSVIPNSATYAYNDGAVNIGPFATNVTPFQVLQNVSLTFVGQTIASTPQGSTVGFTNTLTNTGSGGDVFDVTLGGSTFPAGTSFTLYRSDGVTPLTDSDGNSIPDTGPLAAGGSTTIVLRVTLAPSATGGPYQVQKTATSLTDPAATAVATDVLNLIVAGTVDLTNNSAGPGAPGAGPGPEVFPVVTNTTGPGSTTRFTLYVNNTSTTADNFDLAASTDAAFGAITLPAGWSVTFYDAGNTLITNTGSIAGGANTLVYADVTVPPGFTPGTVGVYFRARSPVSTTQDRIHDAVAVSAQRVLSIVPNNSAQVAPNGAITYTHLLANNGNVVEGDGAGSIVSLATSDNQVGWSSVLYVDSNGNGVWDGADLTIADLGTLGGLAPGASVRLFVRVFAPAGATLGSVNLTTVTAATSNVGYTAPEPAQASATDNSTVINGQLQITKRQALDTLCDGIPDGGYDVLDLSALPAQCLRYEITVTNVGTATVTNLVLSDATPPYTVYSDTVPASSTQGTVSTPLAGAAGTITANIGSLSPGQTVVVVVGLQIEP